MIESSFEILFVAANIGHSAINHILFSKQSCSSILLSVFAKYSTMDHLSAYIVEECPQTMERIWSLMVLGYSNSSFKKVIFQVLIVKLIFILVLM
jgi:hypothetical protein